MENEIEITIKVAVPGEDYNTPKYGPLYLPIRKTTIILIGNNWCRAIDHIKTGGDYWIYAEK